MKLINKRNFCLLLVAVLPVCSVVGCSNDNKGGSLETKVWTVPGTKKINQTYHGYGSLTSNCKLVYKQFKNEWESAQIIITPNKDANYTIELADLKGVDNNAILSKDTFSVFNQKYITIETMKEPNNVIGAGEYPDAILPWETAVQYKENNVKANNNQGIWISLKTPSDQAAGKYAGNFKVIVGGKEHIVPVEVEIFDYALTGVTHSKSAFGLNINQISSMELDGTEAMATAYQNFYLDYKICGGFAGPNYDQALYVDKVIEAAKDPRCSTYPLWWTGGSATTTFKSDGRIAIGDERDERGTTQGRVNTIGWSYSEPLLASLIANSWTNNIDLIEKLHAGFSIYDEFDPNGGDKYNCAIYTIRRYADLIKKLTTIVETTTFSNGTVSQTKGFKFVDADNDAGVGYQETTELKSFRTNLTQDEFNALKAKLVASLKRNKITATTSYLTQTFIDNCEFSIIPTIEYYSPKGIRDYVQNYEDSINADLWTYICENPANPLPTYHIDDELISSRLLGWMMYQYNITGLLYWAANLCTYTQDAIHEAQLVSQDYYQNPLRYPTRNGDGWLNYPGRPYGIFGPVPSIRMMSIRDANEDYDLMYELEDIYKSRGVTGNQFEAILNLITSKLYSGSNCLYDGDILGNFDTSREQLGSLFNLYSKYGAMIENYDVDSDDVALIVSANKDVTVKWNGQTVTGEDQGTYIRYTLPISYAPGATNMPVFEKDGSSDSVTFVFGQAPITYSHEKLYNNLTVKVGTANQKNYISDGVTKEGEITVKVDLQNKDKANANFDFNLANQIIYKGYAKCVLRLYSESASEIKVAMKSKLSNSDTFSSICSTTINQGWNDVELDLSQVSLSETVGLKELRMTLSPASGDSFTENTPIYLSKMKFKG